MSAELKKWEDERIASRVWQSQTSATGALAVSDRHVFAAAGNQVTLLRLETGEQVAKLTVDGEVAALAIGAGHLVVGTTEGRLQAFRGQDQAGRPSSLTTTAETSPAVEPVARNMTASQHSLPDYGEVLQQSTGSRRGYGLILGCDDDALVDTLLASTELELLVIDERGEDLAAFRDRWQRQGRYGDRVAAVHVRPGDLPLTSCFANLVVATERLREMSTWPWPRDEVQRIVRPCGGVAWLDDREPTRREPLEGAGSWTHQYANTANTAASGDRRVAAELALQWFGGPGPSHMVDRHLRAPAPLSAAGRLIVPGEDLVIAIDAYNGTESWQLEVPRSQRYSVPYDCGYMSLSDDGEVLDVAVEDELWTIDVSAGVVADRLPLSQLGFGSDSVWGYVARHGATVVGSCMRSAAARRVASREQIDVDYNNAVGLVTSRSLWRCDPARQKLLWQYDATILHPTICLTAERLFFVASHDAALREHPTGQITLAEFMPHHPVLVCLDPRDGQVVFERPLDEWLTACRNILYLQASEELLIASGSLTRDNDSIYRIAVFEQSSGERKWTAEHARQKPDAFSHGEQVQHPVVLRDRIVCEPAIYALDSGERVFPAGESPAWAIDRPGHGCGTMSGAGDCLFFRAGTPTLLDLAASGTGNRYRSLAPSRPGCWINIIPAGGLVLIPEASASCVCHYALQTSMAFAPKDQGQ